NAWLPETEHGAGWRTVAQRSAVALSPAPAVRCQRTADGGAGLAWGSLLLVLLASLNTLRHKRTLRGLIGLLGLASLALLLLERVLQWHPLFGQGVGMMVFYLAMVASLFNRVIHERPVTGELVYGLLALSLSLALADAMAHQLITTLQPGAFRSPHGPSLSND